MGNADNAGEVGNMGRRAGAEAVVTGPPVGLDGLDGLDGSGGLGRGGAGGFGSGVIRVIGAGSSPPEPTTFMGVIERDAVLSEPPLIGHLVLQTIRDVKWGDLDVLLLDLPPGSG